MQALVMTVLSLLDLLAEHTVPTAVAGLCCSCILHVTAGRHGQAGSAVKPLSVEFSTCCGRGVSSLSQQTSSAYRNHDVMLPSLRRGL